MCESDIESLWVWNCVIKRRHARRARKHYDLQFLLKTEKALGNDDEIFPSSETNGEKIRTLFSFIPFNAFIYWSNRFNKFLCVMPLKRFKIREKCKFRFLYKIFVSLVLHLMKIAFPNNICEIMRGALLWRGREGSFLPFTDNQSMIIALLL